MKPKNAAKLTRAVIRVGDGRGFIVRGGRQDALIITAAHCLPKLPPPHAMSYLEERTFSKLLGPLSGERTVWAECLFVDPVADIAALGEPDNQALFEQWDEYTTLTGECTPLAVDEAISGSRAWMLSLNGKWFSCQAQHNGGMLLLDTLAEPIAAGMSGSPIVADDGSAIGVVCLGGNHAPHPQARLACHLPRGLWDTIASRREKETPLVPSSHGARPRRG